MLLSFRVANFRSIANEMELSLRPMAKYHRKGENVYSLPQAQALNVVSIYGANASGKSNIVKAIGFMRRTVLRSANLGSVDRLHVEPFLLNETFVQEPSLFEVTFMARGQVYRYGFRLSDTQVVEEWLFVSKRDEEDLERALFIREGGKLLRTDRRSLPKLRVLDMDSLLPNVLLLSRLDQLNNTTAKVVMRWFKDLKVLTGSHFPKWETYTAQKLSDGSYCNAIKNFVRMADPNIIDVIGEVYPVDMSKVPSFFREMIKDKESASIQEYRTQMMRRRKDGGLVAFDLDEAESEGTAKMFDIAGPIVDILLNGYTVVVDELEAMLHPLLTRRIIQLFADSKSNPKQAQLIFVSHDVSQLSNRFGVLARDQIWFCAKDCFGQTELYSLAEVKQSSPEELEDFDKKYLEGRYGGIPTFSVCPEDIQ